MSRIQPRSMNAASAFDFDVVTDVVPIPVRPSPAREAKTVEPAIPSSSEKPDDDRTAARPG